MSRVLINLDEDRNDLQRKRKMVLLEGCIHDHPLYLVCPGLLHAVGETSYGIQMGFTGSTLVFIICLCIYLYLRCKVYSCLFNQVKNIFLHKKGKQLTTSLQDNIFVFGDHNVHFLTCNTLLPDCKRPSPNFVICC